jgi:hypothetical protein
MRRIGLTHCEVCGTKFAPIEEYLEAGVRAGGRIFCGECLTPYIIVLRYRYCAESASVYRYYICLGNSGGDYRYLSNNSGWMML